MTTSLLTFAIIGFVIGLFVWLGIYSFLLFLVLVLIVAIYWMGFAVVDMLTHFKRDHIIEARKRS